jgi:hypothetical protein
MRLPSGEYMTHSTESRWCITRRQADHRLSALLVSLNLFGNHLRPRSAIPESVGAKGNADKYMWGVLSDITS